MDKGFGFIACEGQEKDLFFHISEFNGDFDTLEVDTAVTFDITDGDKGLAATNVNLA